MLFRSAGSVRRSIILERQASLMVVCASLLLADLIGRIVLGEAFAVRYPTDRTAMQLVPLFLILLAQCIDRASASIHVAHFASLALLLLPLRALLTANFDHTMYWSEQSIPDAIFLIAEERQRGLGRPLMINAQRHLQPCWWYGNMIRGISANELDPTDFPQASCDLLMIDPAREGPLPGFRVIATASTGHIQLLERIVPIHVRLMVDSILTIGPSNAEYVDLWKPAISASGGEEAFVEFDAKLTTGAAFAGALVLEVSDRNAEHLFYQKLLLDRGRIGWRGDRLHIALRLPPVATPGARIAFYLFDPHREHFRVDDAHVRIHRVEA